MLELEGLGGQLVALDRKSVQLRELLPSAELGLSLGNPIPSKSDFIRDVCTGTVGWGWG